MSTTLEQTEPQAPTQPELPYGCDLCGKRFTRKQGLGRHMSETHGAPTTREKAGRAPAPPKQPRSSGLLAGIEQEMQALVEPMRKRLAKLEREIEAKQAELVELRKGRTYLQGMLGKLEPSKAKVTSAGRAKAAQSVAAKGDAAKIESLRVFISSNADELREGFTASSLWQQMFAAGVQPAMSTEKLRTLLKDLHGQGIVRADKLVRGGGMRYMVAILNGNEGETMARRRPEHATLYDFRDSDLMWHLHEHANGKGVTTHELADLLGFDAEEGGRPVGIRMAWMKRYGMVAFDDRDRSWRLSRSGSRVMEAKLRAPDLVRVTSLPDEAMVEVMAQVTSRFQRGETMLGHMLRREFLYGTKRR